MSSVGEIDPTKTCSKCSQKFLPDDLIQYADVWICAGCKLLFFQTLKETGSLPDLLHQGPQFFAVSKSKLIIMSVCTFGFYKIYWFYKNWSLVKERTGNDIQPVWRAIFTIFFVYQLFRSIKESAQANNVACSWNPGLLATTFILLAFTRRLPGPYSLIVMLNVIPLFAVQSTVNEINAKLAPFADKNEHYSGRNIAVMIIGTLLLGFVVIAIFLKLV
jgi:hypothetical protein